jgi:hypothetical protein
MWKSEIAEQPARLLLITHWVGCRQPALRCNEALLHNHCNCQVSPGNCNHHWRMMQQELTLPLQVHCNAQLFSTSTYRVRCRQPAPRCDQVWLHASVCAQPVADQLVPAAVN